MKIYLAGPMTGYPEFNFPAFFKYAKELKADGYYVFNPAQNDLDNHGTLEACTQLFKDDPMGALRLALGDDLKWITAEADAIAMMPGWERSYGARAEHATAVALGLKVMYLD